MLYTLLSENNVLVSFGWTKIWEICRICQRERGIDLESKANFSTLRYKLRYTFQLKRIEFSNAWFQGRNLNCIQPINTHHTYHRCGSRHPFANPLFAQDFLITPSPATNLFVHEEQSREETVSHRSTILLPPFLWVEWDATSQHRGKSIERCIQLKNNHRHALK